MQLANVGPGPGLYDEHCIHPQFPYSYCCFCGQGFVSKSGKEEKGHGGYHSDNCVIDFNGCPNECWARSVVTEGIA